MNENIINVYSLSATNHSSFINRIHQAAESVGSQRDGLLLFWGPPGSPSDHVEQILECIPARFAAVGASAVDQVIESKIRREEWGGVLLSSRYLKAHTGWANLRFDSVTREVDAKTCVDDFVKSFRMGSPGLDSYFAPRQVWPSHPIRVGAHKVEYHRPAFMILFLHGIAKEKEWPKNQDYAIVEALSVKFGRGMPIFGGSAASRSVDGRWDDPWVAAKYAEANGQPLVKTNNEAMIAGLLVETDLSIGCAPAHGFEADYSKRYRVRKGDTGFLISRPVDPDSPPRFHVAGLEGPHELADGPPSSQGVLDGDGEKPVQPVGGVWHTLVRREPDEILPMCPYKHGPDNTYRFLQPVAEDATLYLAKLTRSTAHETALKAVNQAVESGEVRCPAVILFANCKGRMREFGLEAAEREITHVGTECPAPAFGFFGDSEVCPSPEAANRYRNWTVAALVIGSDYNSHYAEAALAHYKAQLDAEFFTRGGAGDRLWTLLIDAGKVLARAEWIHVRVLEEGDRLRKFCGQGAVWEVIPEVLSIPKEQDPLEHIAIRAHKEPTGEVLDETRAAILRRIAKVRSEEEWDELTEEEQNNRLHMWLRNTNINRSKLSELKSIEWWAAVSIRTDRKLGVLVLGGSAKSSLGKDGRLPEPMREALQELSRRAASYLHAFSITDRFSKVLGEIVSSGGEKGELTVAITNAGAELLGEQAYLTLFRPVGQPPEKLVFAAGKLPPEGPLNDTTRMTLRLRDGDRLTHPAYMGVCGWMYLNRIREMLFDSDEDLRAQSEEFKSRGFGVPSPVPLFGPDISAQYAFLLNKYDPDSPAMGVLSVEAGKNVLNKKIHKVFLERIADACEAVIRQQLREERLWKTLEFLPACVYETLKSNRKSRAFEALSWDGTQDYLSQITEAAPPKRRVVSILYGDIRKYTQTSEAVGEEWLLPFMREYYTLVASEVSRPRARKDQTGNGTRGTLDKFMGDGFIALYGDLSNVFDLGEVGDRKIQRTTLVEVCDAIRWAVLSALAIADRFPVIARRWQTRWRAECSTLSPDPLAFTLGLVVHTGRPTVGLFSTNAITPDGSSDRPQPHLTYTAIGRDVNYAARVGGEVGGNAVYVTATTMTLIDLAKEELSGNIFDFTVDNDGILFDGVKDLGAVRLHRVGKLPRDSLDIVQ